MLKKKLGIEAIEKGWRNSGDVNDYFKIPSTLIIPEGCEKIGDSIFRGGLKNLRKVVVPESVEEIGRNAFDWCWRTTIILKKPMSKFIVGEFAFWECEDVKEGIRS